MRRGRWLPVRSLALALTAVVVTPPAQPARGASTPGVAVTSRLFGMHVNDPGGWPSVPVGSVRLWDSGTTWRDLEPRPGVFDFTRLDAFVARARAHGARVTLVLGQTPEFHVSSAAGPASPVEYLGAGASRMPVIRAWRTYVRSVANRYAGRVEALQVWNEANIVGFWSGTQHQMARLTYWARQEIDRVNRRHRSAMRLVSPSFVARTNTGPMDRYWRQAISGRRMNSLVDRVALSLYPPADGNPEDAVARLVRLRRAILSPRGVTKPIWNTEINYGLALGGASDPVVELERDLQAAYVVRTFLLNAAAGVERVYWYAWGQRGNVSTVLSVDGKPTLAGRAFRRLQRWVVGARLRGCNREVGTRAETFVCTLEARGGETRIFWNPSRTVRLRLGDAATSSTDLYGTRAELRPPSRLRVDARPVLVRYRRSSPGSG